MSATVGDDNTKPTRKVAASMRLISKAPWASDSDRRHLENAARILERLAVIEDRISNAEDEIRGLRRDVDKIG